MGGEGRVSMAHDNYKSYPEIGRAIRRARRFAQTQDKSFTAYQAYKALKALRQRAEGKVRKDPKERLPETVRWAAIGLVLERRRHQHGSNDSEMG